MTRETFEDPIEPASGATPATKEASMSKSNPKGRKGSAKPPRKDRPSVRDGCTRLKIFNSGLEVWCYDEANREVICSSGAMNFGTKGADRKFRTLAKEGTLVGYSLLQDDELDIMVYGGAPLTAAELAIGRWLEPQTALLRLPSGKLCVESNDASRIGPDEPGEKGAFVEVPPGDYRLTLYRIDYEALAREKLEWEGPQEIIVLAPGGKPADAAEDLLPFEPRREASWIRNYKINGNRAEAQAWFSDYWDTFLVNLDSEAGTRLSLIPGTYFRTEVPSLGITIVCAFGTSWNEARRVPPPEGVSLDEYGYAAFSPMSEWNGAEALFCRRERAAKRIEVEHHNLWIPAVVEVLDVKPQSSPKRPSGPGPARSFVEMEMQGLNYFDSGFLALILSDVLPEVGDLEELPLPTALDLLDKDLAKHGVVPLGDLQWEEKARWGTEETACRLYAGRMDGFAAILVREGSFDLLLVSEFDDGTWLVTGLADDFESRLMAARSVGTDNSSVKLQSLDEALESIVSAYQKSLRASKTPPLSSPANLQGATVAFDRFLTAAYG
jgi:hypothetical protein